MWESVGSDRCGLPLLDGRAVRQRNPPALGATLCGGDRVATAGVSYFANLKFLCDCHDID